MRSWRLSWRIALTVLALTGSEARAESAYEAATRGPTTSAVDPDTRASAESCSPSSCAFGFEASASLLGGFVSHPPVVDGLSAANRSSGSPSLSPALARFTFRNPSSTAFAGVDLHVGVWSYFDHSFPLGLNVPLLGLRFADSLGSRNVDQTFTAGTETASLSLDSSSFYEVLLPGLGLNLVTSTVYIRAIVQPTIEHFSMAGSFTQGFLDVRVSASSTTVGFDGSLDVCAHLDATNALCVSAKPLLWRDDSAEDHLFNGILFGVGWRGGTVSP